MTSNVGETGVESIRLGGHKIENLPIRERHLALDQMPKVNAMSRKGQIDNIRARYPKQSIAWVDGTLRECDNNLVRIRDFIGEQEKMTNEYMGQISLCKHRDKEIAKLDPEKDIDAIKKLRLQFPPYNVEAMQNQIKQNREAVNRADVVIDTEHNSIAELKALHKQLEERDRKLKTLGG